MKLFKDWTLLTGRNEPQVPPEVYGRSRTLSGLPTGQTDPKQAAEEASQRTKASSLDYGCPVALMILTPPLRHLTDSCNMRAPIPQSTVK
jgi:hypothetical protein